MPSPSRVDLENAAREFFDEMARELERPRAFHAEYRDDEIAYNVETSRSRILALDEQLQDNSYDAVVEKRALNLVDRCASGWSTLSENERTLALRLSARVEREQMEMLVHGLVRPAQTFSPVDQFFAGPLPLDGGATTRSSIDPAAVPAQRKNYPSLVTMVEDFTADMRRRKLGQSQIDEVGRILRWLMEELAPSISMAEITTDQVRTFRNDIQRMDRTRQGRASSFRRRLTDIPERQLASATAQKYWSAVQALFAYAHAEGRSPSDPAALLKIGTRKGETRRSPEPMSTEELKRLYSTPLFTGYQSPSRLTSVGECHERGQHWWSGVLPLWTGLRAGELTQLLPSDFVFDAEIPHLLVQETDGDGLRTKSTKNESSVRAVPLSPVLLELGLQQFVERRSKLQPKARIFQRFRLGTGGKISEGMGRFWGDYLRKFGLHKPGRATHVMRHTIVQFLRAANVAEEDIAAVVGHSRGTQTSRYGRKDFPLARKLASIQKLDFGFDMISTLGGAYHEMQHRE